MMRSILSCVFAFAASQLAAQEIVIGLTDSTQVVEHMPNGWDFDTLQRCAEVPKAYSIYVELDTLTNERLTALLELRTNAILLEIICTYVVIDRTLPDPWSQMEALEIFGANGVENERQAQSVLIDLSTKRPGLFVALNGWTHPE